MVDAGMAMERASMRLVEWLDGLMKTVEAKSIADMAAIVRMAVALSHQVVEIKQSRGVADPMEEMADRLSDMNGEDSIQKQLDRLMEGAPKRRLH